MRPALPTFVPLSLVVYFMRLFAFLLFPAFILLAACSKEPRPVRLDFIGSSRFTSTNRRASPGDTLSVRLYASGSDSINAPLSRFQVTVTYEPTRNPVIYPAIGYVRNLENDLPIVYLDKKLSAQEARQFLYQSTFGTRTTSGNERWEFTLTDAQANKITRSFRLRIANPDSLALYHQYLLRVPAAPASPARPLVALLSGLAFPTTILEADAANGKLIDIVYRPGNTSLEVYQGNPVGSRAVLHTILDTARFTSLNNPEQLSAAFEASQAAAVTTTGPLLPNSVYAFSTVEGNKGVFRVRRILQTPYPMLELLVRVRKD
jgi:hypothetical protein